MPEYFKTRREVVERALGALGKLPAGQSPSAEDVNLVDGFVEPMLGILAAREVVNDIGPDEFPPELYIPLGLILADQAKSDFQVIGQEAVDLSLAAAKAEVDIRLMVGGRPTYEPQEVEYF